MDQARNPASRPGGESAPELTAALERELEEFAAQKAASERRVRDLRAAEDPAAGIFHAREIFEEQQNKLRLEVEVDLRRKRINRIRLAEAEQAEFDRLLIKE